MFLTRRKKNATYILAIYHTAYLLVVIFKSTALDVTAFRGPINKYSTESNCVVSFILLYFILVYLLLS